MGWNLPSSRWRVVKRMRQPSVSGLASAPTGRASWAGSSRLSKTSKCAGPALQLVEGGAKLLVRRTFENLGTQPAADLSQALRQWLGRVDPEDAVRVGVLESVDVLDRELGLADAAHAGEPRGPDADGLALLQGGVQPLQVVGAADEVVIPGERHEERKLARRGLCLVSPELANGVPDAPGDIGECLITVVPTGHGFPIGRQGLKLAERGEPASHRARRMTGITRASPWSCRSRARVISTS